MDKARVLFRIISFSSLLARCQHPISSHPMHIIPPPRVPTRPRSHSSKRHRLLNLRNRLAGIQPLRARPRAVQNRVTPVQTHAVVEHLLALRFVLVAGVGEPAVGLEEDGGAEVFFAVPPVGGAGCRAASAEDAFIEPVEFFAVFWGLSVFETIFGFGVTLQVWFDGFVLLVELSQVRDEIFDDVGVG